MKVRLYIKGAEELPSNVAQELMASFDRIISVSSLTPHYPRLYVNLPMEASEHFAYLDRIGNFLKQKLGEPVYLIDHTGTPVALPIKKTS